MRKQFIAALLFAACSIAAAMLPMYWSWFPGPGLFDPALSAISVNLFSQLLIIAKPLQEETVAPAALGKPV